MEKYIVKEYTPKIRSDEFDNYRKRYAVYDEDGKIIDDAQGYGFKTISGAHKAMWYINNKNCFKERNKDAKQIISTNKVLVDNKWILGDYVFLKDGEDVVKIFWERVKDEDPELYKNLGKKVKNDIVRLLQ